MLVYYAHCLAIYNTPQETRDLKTIADLGFYVSNPNSRECDEGYKREGMDFFKRFAGECGAVVFRALPDGTIPAGIAKELQFFKEAGKPMFELPSCVERRVLTVAATREYLSETGHDDWKI